MGAMRAGMIAIVLLASMVVASAQAVTLGEVQVLTLGMLPAPLHELLPEATRATMLVMRSGSFMTVTPAAMPADFVQARLDAAAALHTMLAFEFKLTPSVPEHDAWILWGATVHQRVPVATAQYLKPSGPAHERTPAAILVPIAACADERTFLHECAHLALARLQPLQQRSLWLEEGLAELCSDAQGPGHRMQLERVPRLPARFAAHASTWREPAAPPALTLREMLDAAEPTRDAWLRTDPKWAQMFMAQAHALVQFLRHVQPDGKIRVVADNKLLRRVLLLEGRAEGALHGREAFVAALGSDWNIDAAAGLFRMWLRWCAAQADTGAVHHERALLRGTLSIGAP